MGHPKNSRMIGYATMGWLTVSFLASPAVRGADLDRAAPSTGYPGAAYGTADDYSRPILPSLGYGSEGSTTSEGNYGDRTPPAASGEYRDRYPPATSGEYRDRYPPATSGEYRDRYPPATSGEYRDRYPPATSGEYRDRYPPTANGDYRDRYPPAASGGYDDRYPPAASGDYRDRYPPAPARDERDRCPPTPDWQGTRSSGSIPPPPANTAPGGGWPDGGNAYQGQSPSWSGTPAYGTSDGQRPPEERAAPDRYPTDRYPAAVDRFPPAHGATEGYPGGNRPLPTDRYAYPDRAEDRYPPAERAYPPERGESGYPLPSTSSGKDAGTWSSPSRTGLPAERPAGTGTTDRLREPASRDQQPFPPAAQDQEWRRLPPQPAAQDQEWRRLPPQPAAQDQEWRRLPSQSPASLGGTGQTAPEPAGTAAAPPGNTEGSGSGWPPVASWPGFGATTTAPAEQKLPPNRDGHKPPTAEASSPASDTAVGGKDRPHHEADGPGKAPEERWTPPPRSAIHTPEHPTDQGSLPLSAPVGTGSSKQGLSAPAFNLGPVAAPP